MELFQESIQLSFMLLLIFASCASSGVYFPMGDVEVTLPIGRRLDRPLVTLKALPTKPLAHLESFNYTVDGSELFQQQAASGRVMFESEFSHRYTDTDSAEAVVSAADVTGDHGNTTLKLSFTKLTKDYCDIFANELCFWRNVTYQLYENRPPTTLGSLSSGYLPDLCPGYSISYTLINGTDYLKINKSIAENEWQLFSLKPFERDTHCYVRHGSPSYSGARVFFTVNCTVLGPDGTERFYREDLQLNLLDENDNPPRSQNNNLITIHVGKNSTLEDHLALVNNLMFIDRDSERVNNYTIKLLNDDAHLFEKDCTQYQDDRFEKHQTIIKCEILKARNARSLTGSYEVVLQINDTSLLPGHGDSVENVTIRFLDTEPQKNILYPESTTIFRSAAFLARVAEPQDRQKPEIKFKLKYDSTRRNQEPGAFNITSWEGIVFVQNMAILRHSFSPVTLNIEWENTTSNFKYEESVKVIITSEGLLDCEEVHTIKPFPHCADFDRKKDCVANFALGTGGMYSNTSRCIWRNNKSTKNVTANYPTCTPDERNCPNNICDALEMQHDLLCPQDCTDYEVTGVIEKNKHGKGIEKAIGVCRCDVTSKCSCGDRTKIFRSKTTTTVDAQLTTEIPQNTSNKSSVFIVRAVESNASAHTATDILTDLSTCGLPCLIGIGVGAVFLLGVIMGVVVCWRYTHGGKGSRRERKFVENVNAINGVHSDYVDRTINSAETLLLNFEMNTGLANAPVMPKIIPIVDPKWEFPRDKLRIEQTLGEGEFGRVLRAKAFEIAGLPGYTTVAVKTLKEDAREAELADLMSEYQLLKDVSHPNVIRLLGASTVPGGPVYLIIEFAEHGSLRNYLRRSRHLEAEGRTPCSGAMLGEAESPMIPKCKITPRDILSFAWQISKGMSYLTDMKLVHRDLAARNVLLATGMVCKISDFGLTRDVYEDDSYLKRTKGRVPVKWMAPESLADHIYNAKTDVWSFGILLWELVTLGASPYPGVAVQNLFHLLKSGFRMERPDNCSPALYKIMRSCWNEAPMDRPSFRSLTLKLESMLADGIDYLDLNPRVVHNRTYFTSLAESANTPDEIDEAIKFGFNAVTETSTVNLLSETNLGSKCADVDKIQVLWKRPESPKPSNTRTYENEAQAHEMNHYESPIKFRNKAEGLQTPTNDRPQSYIDMAGNSNRDTQSLVTPTVKEEIEQVSKVTSL